MQMHARRLCLWLRSRVRRLSWAGNLLGSCCAPVCARWMWMDAHMRAHWSCLWGLVRLCDGTTLTEGSVLFYSCSRLHAQPVHLRTQTYVVQGHTHALYISSMCRRDDHASMRPKGPQLSSTSMACRTQAANIEASLLDRSILLWSTLTCSAGVLFICEFQPREISRACKKERDDVD